MKEKTAGIRELVPPTNVHEIQQVMGIFNYFRKFIPNFSEIAKGIEELTKKGVKFEWTPARQVAFETLKGYLTRSPVLIYPDPNKEYYLFTNASKYTWSAILMHINDIESVGAQLQPVCIPKWNFQEIPAQLGYPEKRSLCHLHCI